MKADWINPFIEAFNLVMPQLGFNDVKRKNVSIEAKNLKSSGVSVNVGIIGDLSGNVIYDIDEESSKKIASRMLMGMPVEALDDMSKSALCEMANMLAARASSNFAENDILINISPPSLTYGSEFWFNTKQYICIEMAAEDIPVRINVAIQKGKE